MENQDEQLPRPETVAPNASQQWDPLLMEAMMSEITRRLEVTFANRANQANEFFYGADPLAGRPARGGRLARGGRFGRGARVGARRRTRHETEEELFDHSEDSGFESPIGEGNRQHHRRARIDDNLGSLKLRIPPFSGKNDPDAYLEWEKKIEMVFSCQNFSEEKKVKLATTEFNGYAINWWDQIATVRRRNGEPQITSWFEMKTVMRKRFVPTHYGRDLHQKLRKLSQGARSVEDYHQEMESLLIKAEVDETMEASMARFQGGLNRDIQDRLELQDYEDMDDLLHKAILIEQQNKRRGNTRLPYASMSKPPYHREDKTGGTSFRGAGAAKPSEGVPNASSAREEKGKGLANPSAAPTKPRNIRCFRCQGFGHYASECTNKKVMIILDNGEVVSGEEESTYDPKWYPQNPVFELEDEAVTYPVQGELLVTRRTLNTQPKIQEQRENLFHTRCLIQDKVCSLIIDGGSCTNVASQILVDKLNLTTDKHPRPYQLQWLNEAGEMWVREQVKVPITIGKYQDEILCDVLPMDSSHILLGRPWQYDKRVLHDGFTNRHSFVHKGKQIILVPLTPQEVHHDQVKLRMKKEEAKVAAPVPSAKHTC